MKTNYLKKWWAVALMMLTMGAQVNAQTAAPQQVHTPTESYISEYDGAGYEVFYFKSRTTVSPKTYSAATITASANSWLNMGSQISTSQGAVAWPTESEFYAGRNTSGSPYKISSMRWNSEANRQIVMLVKGYSEVAVVHSSSTSFVIDTEEYDGSSSYGNLKSTTSSGSNVQILRVALDTEKQYKITFRGATASNYTAGIAAFSLKVPLCDAINTTFSVTGNDEICEGSKAPVGLSGSQVGVSYQLYKDGVAEGSPKAGDGAAINFGDFGKGVYTVKGTGTGDFCPAETAMTGSATITEVLCGATYDLSINVSLEGAGNVSGAGTYPQDETVDISAAANRGFDFVNWTGATTVADPNAASTTIDLTDNITLTANFVAKTARNLVATVGTGVISATVKNITEAEASNYFDGEIAEFTAEINNNDFAFDGWYNGSTKVSADLITEQTVNGDLTLEARVIERPVLSATVELGSITDKTATLSWDEVAGATGYAVELCKSTITTKTLTFPAANTLNYAAKAAAENTFAIGDFTIGYKMMKTADGVNYCFNGGGNGGLLYNKTALGKIKTISFTNTQARKMTVYFGNSIIVNSTSGDYTITSDANTGSVATQGAQTINVADDYGDYTYFCFNTGDGTDTKIANIVITYEAGGVDCLPIVTIPASTTEIDLATEFGPLDPETEYTYTVTAIGSIANPSSGDFLTNATPANPLESFRIKWSDAVIENGAITFPEGLNTDQIDCMETYFTLADDFTDCTVWLDGKQLVYEQIGEWGEAAWVCYGDIRAFTGTIEVVSPASSAVKGIQKAAGDPHLSGGTVIAEYSLDTNSQNVSTGLGADKTNSPEVKDCFNVLGVQVPCESNGIVIKRFTDGSTAKTLNK